MDRVGIHLGEVVIRGNLDGVKPRDLYGIQIDTCARVMGLAAGGQILMTRAVVDNARQVLKGEELGEIGALSWLNHSLYQLNGVNEPVEVCEMGKTGGAPLSAPADSEKAHPFEITESEPILGWRPAIGQSVPKGKSGSAALDEQQIPGESQLRPKAGDRVRREGQKLTWRAVHLKKSCLLDFGRGEHCVAYAVCYLWAEAARPE